LAFTYWVVGVIGGLLFRIYDIYLDQSGYYDVITEEKQIFIWLFILVSTGYSLFSLVCIWRSANNYRISNVNSKKAIWGTLAKVAVVLGVLRMLADWVEILKAA
jgi:hypothetical protein